MGADDVCDSGDFPTHEDKIYTAKVTFGTRAFRCDQTGENYTYLFMHGPIGQVGHRYRHHFAVLLSHSRWWRRSPGLTVEGDGHQRGGH